MYVFLCSYLFYNFEFEAIEKSVQLMPQIKCTLCQILVHSALRGGGPVLKQFLHFMRMVIMYFLRAMNASKAYFASGWHSRGAKAPNFHSSLAKQTIFMSVPSHFFSKITVLYSRVKLLMGAAAALLFMSKSRNLLRRPTFIQLDHF